MRAVTNDEYLQSQIIPMLAPGEQVLQSAYMRRQPGMLMQILLVGGLLLMLLTKVYFVVITNRRMILIRTKMTAWAGAPKHMNLGVEVYDTRSFARCTTSGFAMNRSMTWDFHQGGSMTLRITPWTRHIAGSKQFFEQVPQMVTSGYLAQIAAGAPPVQQPLPVAQLQHPGPPPQQHMQHAGQQQYPQHPGPAQPQPFGPGTPVVVTVPDGNRYRATIAQVAPGQYLCAMPDGQSYWFPVQAVAIA